MIKRSLLASAIACLFSLPVAAADYSNTWFFGDSLTDSGTFTPFLPPGTGKFTTNPGPVWSENIAGSLGTNGSPATIGGNNFAQGGARVTGLPGVPDTNPLTAAALPIRDQISAYLARVGSADSNALYTVWGGANDLFVAAVLPPAAAPGYVTTTANELVGEIARLRNAGARYILVPTVPDIGATPFGAAQGAAGAAGLTALSSGYNQLLFSGLNAGGIQAIPVDIFGLLHEVIADPALYGFVNVTTPACGATGSLVCTAADFVAPNANQTFLFADGVHPTTAGHRIVSDFVLGLIAAPRQISLLAETPIKTRAALVGTIYDHIATSFWAQPMGESEVWVSAGGGRLKFSQSSDFAGANGTPLGVTVGVDRKLWPGFLVGAAASAARYKPDFADDGGSYTQKELVLSLYGAMQLWPIQINVVGALGSIDYDVERKLRLGPAVRTIDGSPSGTNLSLAVLGSWELGGGALRHGPLLGLLAQRVTVDGFSESNGGSAGLSYASQKRNSAVGSIGYQASYDVGSYLPFARVTLDHDFKKNNRVISASSLSVPFSGSFELPAAAPDRTYGTVVLGVGAKFAPTISGSLALSAQVGQDNVRNYGLQATLSMGF